MLLSSILSEYYASHSHHLARREGHLLMARADEHHPHTIFFIVAACLIPVLVILSGIFAGLTLGYMSLDETQLNVLASSGSPKQREYAKKIMPIRKNGHLLLVSLLLANMVVNETLPVISDEVLGGGVLAVAVSTVLIVIFSEIIPQSICTRYGLFIGAKFVVPVRILMYSVWIVAFPVAKLLEYTLGPHHGIIYRRAELKELINMHSSVSPHGGDLKLDTVTIIGHTLDLQEKTARDAMTPIEKVFMLPIDARLDYETLRRVCESGHSRVPVYEEVEVMVTSGDGVNGIGSKKAKKVKKIVGILLVKQCVLLDPKDATLLRSIPLNKVPSVPFDEPLLGILDRFQEGRSHMAIVSLFSKGRTASVKEAVKTGLTRRFLNRVGLGEEEEDDVEKGKDDIAVEKVWDDLREGKITGKEGDVDDGKVANNEDANANTRKLAIPRLEVPRFTKGLEGREQAMPADAVLASRDADNFLRGIDTEVNPLGIITLEDVLEELIGEEILDEFDLTGPQAASSYVPPAAEMQWRDMQSHSEQFMSKHSHSILAPAPVHAMRGPGIPGLGLNTSKSPTGYTPRISNATRSSTTTVARSSSGLQLAGGLQFPKVASTLNIFNRSRSQPGTPRGGAVETGGPILEREVNASLVSGHGDEKGVLSDGENNNENEKDADGERSGGDTDVTFASTEAKSGGTALKATLTGETGTTLGDYAGDNLSSSLPAGHVKAPTGQRGGSPKPPPMHALRAPSPVREAILQTQSQNRRRAQAQLQGAAGYTTQSPTPSISQIQSQESTSGVNLAGEGASPATIVPVIVRQGPKGRFKSSPLVGSGVSLSSFSGGAGVGSSTAPAPAETASASTIHAIPPTITSTDSGANDTEKVPESDPDLKTPRDGLIR